MILDQVSSLQSNTRTHEEEANVAALSNFLYKRTQAIRSGRTELLSRVPGFLKIMCTGLCMVVHIVRSERGESELASC